MDAKKLLSLLSTTLLMTACGSRSQLNQHNIELDGGTEGIVGGSEVSQSDELGKSTVALLMKSANGGVSLCTGTLIADQTVLTAAHCLIGSQAVIVNFSRNSDFSQLQAANVRRVNFALVNPKFGKDNSNGDNDLAILRFKGTTPEGFKNAKLLTDAKLLSEKQPVVLVGFGATGMKRGQGVGSGILRTATVELSNPSLNGSELLLKQTTDGKGACHGDSGGPAFVKLNNEFVQVGITSRSATEAGGSTCLEGSIYTNVASHADFINSATAKLDSLAKEAELKAAQDEAKKSEAAGGK